MDKTIGFNFLYKWNTLWNKRTEKLMLWIIQHLLAILCKKYDFNIINWSCECNWKQTSLYSKKISKWRFDFGTPF